MSDRDLLDRIDALGADTLYFIRTADGEQWSAHVRIDRNGPLGYQVATSPTLRGAVTAAVEPPVDKEEWEDLL